MRFVNGNTTCWTSMSSACSQFEIDTEMPFRVSLSGSKSYTYLTLDETDSKMIRQVAKMIGIVHEQLPKTNRFMVYNTTFTPVKDWVKSKDSCDTVLLKKIFDIVAVAIKSQLNLTIALSYLSSIQLRKTIDFSFKPPKQASELYICLSEEAANDLEINENEEFRRYLTGDETRGMISYPINPGQSKIVFF